MNENFWTARRDALLAASMRRAQDAIALRELEAERVDACQVRIQFRGREQAPCVESAGWWVECRVCGSWRLACDSHAVLVASQSPAFCMVCRHEKPSAVELFGISALPEGRL